MSLLLVDKSGVRVCRESRRFKVCECGTVLLEARACDVDTIVLAGRVGMTRPAIDLALESGINVVFETVNGRLRGSLSAPTRPDSQLRRAQYRALESDEVRAFIVKTILLAQLTNQRGLLRRLELSRRGLASLILAMDSLDRALGRARDTNNLQSLRGVEGFATRAVYTALRDVLGEGVFCDLRTPRGGGDCFNVVLDALGGLLASTCRAALEAAGLDPYAGALHGESRRAPALALDLEDAYRPLLVLAPAVSLFTKSVLSPGDFLWEEARCSLTEEGFKKVCRGYGTALHRCVARERGSQARDYLHHVHEDARSIALWLAGGAQPGCAPLGLLVVR